MSTVTLTLTKGELNLLRSCVGSYLKEVDASVNDEKIKVQFPAAHKSVTALKGSLNLLDLKLFDAATK